MTFEEWWEDNARYTADVLFPSKERNCKKRLANKAWQAAQPQWQPPETAPKDGTVFLGDFGYPWALAAVWNGASENFVIADLQAGLYRGKYNDTYFENEHQPEKELKHWMPLPEPPKE